MESSARTHLSVTARARRSRFVCSLDIVIALLAVAIGSFSVPAFAKPTSWKVVQEALLRINGAPPKDDWGIYQAGRKNDPLLLQMGGRFFFFQISEHRVFEIDPSKVQQKAGELLWDTAAIPATPLESTAWDRQDIGGAYSIHVTLGATGQVLDIQIPHAPDTADLPVRVAGPRRRPN